VQLKNNLNNYGFPMLKIFISSRTTESSFDLMLEYAVKKIDGQILINYNQTI